MKVEQLGMTLVRSVLLVLILAWAQSVGAQTLEKVRIGMPSLSLSFVAPQVAYAKGFFREEGIDAEIIRIATNVGLVAVTTKEIGYTTAVGAALRAGVKGLPIKIVTYFNGRPLHVLVAKREFKSVAELRGKVIGFAGYGDSTEFMLRAMLGQAGMGLEKDVQAFPGLGQRPTASSLAQRQTRRGGCAAAVQFRGGKQRLCPVDGGGGCVRNQCLGTGAAQRYS